MSRARCLLLALALLAPAALLGTATGSASGAAGPRCRGVAATLFGTPGDDEIVGTPGADVLVGLEGRDTLDGRGGDDLICGGGGADTLIAGPGSARVYADKGDDTVVAVLSRSTSTTVRGGPGLDRVVVQRGPARRSGPVLSVDAGRATYSFAGYADPGGVLAELELWALVGTGPWSFRGTPAPDVVDASGAEVVRVRTLGGDDTVTGTRAADRLSGGGGTDTVRGGPGRDRCRAFELGVC